MVFNRSTTYTYEWQLHQGITYEDLYNDQIANYYSTYEEEELLFDCVDYTLYGIINFAYDYSLPVAFASPNADKFEKHGIVTNSNATQFSEGEWKEFHSFIGGFGENGDGMNLGAREFWSFAQPGHENWKGNFLTVTVPTTNPEGYGKTNSQLEAVKTGDLHIFDHHVGIFIENGLDPGYLIHASGNFTWVNGKLTMKKSLLMKNTYSYETLHWNLNSRGSYDPSLVAKWRFSFFDKY
ncbi:MAG: hypothetical protein KDC92_12335 [Bacteroidetes bacterium]|nr:hypothetical protein [Bacteroidota bacterium]